MFEGFSLGEEKMQKQNGCYICQTGTITGKSGAVLRDAWGPFSFLRASASSTQLVLVCKWWLINCKNLRRLRRRRQTRDGLAVCVCVACVACPAVPAVLYFLRVCNLTLFEGGGERSEPQKYCFCGSTILIKHIERCRKAVVGH